MRGAGFFVLAVVLTRVVHDAGSLGSTRYLESATNSPLAPCLLCHPLTTSPPPRCVAHQVSALNSQANAAVFLGTVTKRMVVSPDIWQLMEDAQVRGLLRSA